MDFSGRQHIPYNRELFVFLPWEKMSVSHRHGDVLMTHELLQLHKRDLAGLSQPGCEGMSHGMQGDGVQTITILRGQIELSDGSLEASGVLVNAVFLRGCWKMSSAGLRLYVRNILLISSSTRRKPICLLSDDIEAAGVGIHILSAQLENFCGPESGSQGKQGHVMQLRMPLFEVVQKGFGFLSGQETQSFIVGFDHFPSTAFGGQRLTPLHIPVATARFMAERMNEKMLFTVCPARVFRFRVLVLDFPAAFLGFVFPVGVFRSCALRLESKFGVSSTTGRA